MPTILRDGAYRSFFYTNDNPPMHIHIEKDNKIAKFNLEPLELINSKKLNASELIELRKLIEYHQEFFKQKWHEYFNYS